MFNDRAVLGSVCIALSWALGPTMLFAGVDSCRDLKSLTDATLSVTSASLVAESVAGPEHCHVTGFILPNVGFEVKLPSDWNGKFFQAGNGGFAGLIQDNQTYGLRRGYATAATDTGHEGPNPEFALSRAAEIDFGYRAVHVTQAAAKRLISAYYGRMPRYSYFKGCSTGGRQALMEAQRFPQDFDGIIAGAPIYDFSLKQAFNAAWAAKALFGDGRKGLISLQQLKTLGAAVYAKCDGLDGQEDGLIDDPRNCPFDARQDLPECDGSSSEACFTEAQISAISKIYQGPGKFFKRPGETYPGHVPGGEWLPGTDMENRLTGGWDLYLIGQTSRPGEAVKDSGLDAYLDSYGGDPFLPVQLRNADNFFRFFAWSPDRPEFDFLTELDFAKMPAQFASEAAIDARDPDLSVFHQRGGKLILWHGWADVGLIPVRTIQYFEAVRNSVGNDIADEFVRLFMAPGVYHCEGGPGPDLFDDLTALERWVEEDQAPERMEAFKMPDAPRPPGYIGERTGLADIDQAEFSRPLCAYPNVARYSGSGAIRLSESYECVAP